MYCWEQEDLCVAKTKRAEIVCKLLLVGERMAILSTACVENHFDTYFITCKNIYTTNFNHRMDLAFHALVIA